MNRLRMLREDHDWTLAHVGAMIGATATTVSRYETGKRALTAESIKIFCTLYGVSADYLLGFTSWQVETAARVDVAILSAYHAAPAEVKRIVHVALAPYQQEISCQG